MNTRLRTMWAALVATVSLSLLAVTSRAELLSGNDPRLGPSSLTIDTRTGLAWLDLPFSLDLSYLQAEAATQPGGQFEGFRHATAEEVRSLYLSAGFDNGFVPETSLSFPNVSSLISLVGATGENAAAGITGTMFPNSSVAMAYLSYGSQSGIPGYFVSVSSDPLASLQYGLDTHYDTVGNWLVLVPEPSTSAVLVGAGALALLAGKRPRSCGPRSNAS